MKPRLSDVIKYQQWCADVLLEQMQPRMGYPFDLNKHTVTETSELLGLSDYDWYLYKNMKIFNPNMKVELEKADFKTSIELNSELIDEVKYVKDLQSAAEKKYNLGELKIDRTGSLIIDKGGNRFILLGEINQMSGHITVCDIKTGTIIPVIHAFDFFVARPCDV